MSSDVERTPVLIAGGGIAGLSASLFLSRQRVGSVLVERHRGTSIHPRSRGVNGRTMELFREVGIDERVRAAGAALAPAFGIYHGATLAEVLEPVARDVERPGMGGLQSVLGEISPTAPSRGTQDLVEPVLRAAAEERGGDLRFGTELTSFAQDAEGVTATLLEREGGRERTVRAAYLIAADGANSRTRAALGTPVTGAGVLGHLLNVLFEADLREFVRGREFSICLIDRPEVRGMFTSIDNARRWVFHIVYRPDRGESPADFPPARCAELIQLALGLPGTPVEVVSVLPWESAVRVAARLRHGRVFLAGDAAHQMPPWGGKGANTAVQDVYDLAWKLAAVLGGRAGGTLLDTYDAERQPVGRRAAEESGAAAGADGLMSLDRAAGMAQSWARLLGYGIQYRSPAISAEDDRELADDEPGLDGRPGTRAPHVWVERDSVPVSTLDLAGTRWALLAGPAGAAWLDAARAAGSRLGVEVAAHRVGPERELRDPEGVWAQRAGVGEGGALLLRPDSFVAWRARHAPEGPEAAARALEGALDRALCRRGAAKPVG